MASAPTPTERPTWSNGQPMYDMDDLHAHAAARGGKCMSAGPYTNNKEKYEWQCGDCDHRWMATWNNVSSCCSWCPKCRNSIRESICRAAMCELFPGEAFETDRTTIGAELDGYSPRFKIAFEHDGVHHAEHVAYFQKTEADFQAQQARDARKDELCAEHGIRLIRIPDRKRLDQKNIREFVHEAVTRVLTSDERAEIPSKFASDREFMDSVQISRRRTDYRPDALEYVEARGGELLSKKCVAYKWPLYVRCSDGHEFETHYDHLRRGRWCPECGQGEPVTEERVSAFVEELGHEFRDLYVREEPSTRRNAKNEAVEYTRYRWVVDYGCSKGHDVRGQDWDNIKAGKGCEQCRLQALAGTRRLAPDAIVRRAAACGVTIQSEYKNLSTPVVMECDVAGHRFTSTLKTTELRQKAGTSCPVCTSTNGFGPMRLDQPWPIDADLTKTPLAWKCDDCNAQESATYCGISRRKHKCKCAKKK